jgi:fructosamine-3-kinase
MKHYTQFLDFFNGKIQEPCGSDSVFILDGRNTLETMIQDSKDRLEKMKNVHPTLIGFKVMKGERFDNSVSVYSYTEELPILPPTEEEGVAFIVALQKYARIHETNEQALIGWRAMSTSQKLRTKRAWEIMRGVTR